MHPTGEPLVASQVLCIQACQKKLHESFCRPPMKVPDAELHLVMALATLESSRDTRSQGRHRVTGQVA